MFKHLLFLTLFTLIWVSNAVGQISQPKAMRVYRDRDQVILADSSGAKPNSFPASSVSIVPVGNRVRVGIDNTYMYFPVEKFRDKNGNAYSSVSVDSAVTKYVKSLPDPSVQLEQRVVHVASITDLTATQGTSAAAVNVRDPDMGGLFTYYPASSSLTVDNGVVFPAQAGGYYVRQLTGKLIKGEWFALSGNGTNETTKLRSALAAVPDGGTLELPKSNTYYSLGYIPITGKNVRIRGNGSLIRPTSATAVFDYTGSWGTANSVTSISVVTDSVNNSAYKYRRTVKLTLSTSPQQLAVDDIVKVYSDNDIPQSRFTGRKVGEFAKVAKISGNDVYLQADLRDRSLYTTNIRVARLNKATLSIEGVTFERNTALTGTGSSVGADSYIRITSAYKPVLRDITINGSFSNAITLWSCYSYLADNVNANDLPDDQDNARFGYAIVDAQSEYGIVQNCTWTNVRHGFTTNTYAAGQTTPNAYGRSAYFTVANCQVVGGLYSGFDTHDEAYGGTFRGCRHVGANYRDLPGTVSVPSGFNNRGTRMRYESCEAVNCDVGFLSQSGGERVGGDTKANWSAGVEYINCKGTNLTRSAFVLERSPGAVIVGGYFEDRIDGFPSDLVSIELSDVTVSNKATFKHYAPGNSVGVFGLTNADLRVSNVVIDVSIAILNGSSQCINYNNSLVVIRANSTANQVVNIKQIEVNAGDRPMNALLSNVSGQSANSLIKFDGIDYVRNSGTITCSDSQSRSRGSLAVGNGLSGVSTLNGWIRDFYQQNPTALATTATFAYSTRSSSTASPTTTDPATWFQYRGDFRFTIDVTPTANIALGSFPSGYYRGQIATIRHNSTSNTITISDGSGRSIPGGTSIVLNAGDTVDFMWDGTTWKKI